MPKIQPATLPCYGGGEFLFNLDREQYLSMIEGGQAKAITSRRRYLGVYLLEDTALSLIGHIPTGQKTSVLAPCGDHYTWEHTATAKNWLAVV